MFEHFPVKATQKWIYQLRYGGYKQCVRHYYNNGSYCALGVLKYKLREFRITKDMICSPIWRKVATLNDNEGKSLSEIADFLESRLALKIGVPEPRIKPWGASR